MDIVIRQGARIEAYASYSAFKGNKAPELAVMPLPEYSAWSSSGYIYIDFGPRLTSFLMMVLKDRLLEKVQYTSGQKTVGAVVAQELISLRLEGHLYFDQVLHAWNYEPKPALKCPSAAE